MMNQRLLLIASWSALALIAFVTLSPIEDRPTFGSAQLERFIAFALLGFAFVRAYPRRPLFSAAIVIGCAVWLEALQLLTPDRHGRLLDALVKLTGGMCGIGFGQLAAPLLREQFVRIKQSLGSGRSASRPAGDS
jgi:hypothetical protein